MTCPMSTPPVGFIMSWELIDAFLLSLCSVLRRVPGITLGVRLSRLGGTDFCLITRQVALKGAIRILLVLLSMIRSHLAIATECAGTFISPVARPGSLTRQILSQVRQISPDKNVNFHHATAAFTLSPESWASLCGANLHGDWALYVPMKSGLIALPEASFGRSLTVPPLPSASTFVNMFNILTGFTYRGLSPHKFTPMPGVHLTLHRTP